MSVRYLPSKLIPKPVSPCFSPSDTPTGRLRLFSSCRWRWPSSRERRSMFLETLDAKLVTDVIIPGRSTEITLQIERNKTDYIVPLYHCKQSKYCLTKEISIPSAQFQGRQNFKYLLICIFIFLMFQALVHKH